MFVKDGSPVHLNTIVASRQPTRQEVADLQGVMSPVFTAAALPPRPHTFARDRSVLHPQVIDPCRVGPAVSCGKAKLTQQVHHDLKETFSSYGLNRRKADAGWPWRLLNKRKLTKRCHMK